MATGYQVGGDLNRFDAATAAAVRSWHQKVGLPNSDAVPLGEVIFVPTSALDRPLRWSKAIAPGVRVSPGDPLLEVLSTTPQVVVEFGGSPPAQLSPPIGADVAFIDGTRRTMTMQSVVTDKGRTWSALVPVGSLCEVAACPLLVPLDRDSGVTATFTLVPKSAGSLVPVAVVRSDAASQSFVVLADGRRRDVSIKVADGGLAIVAGVAPGDILLLP